MSDPRSTDNFDMGTVLRGLIAARIESHGRSLQREIGASELGTPCDRKLAMKLHEVDPVPEQVGGDDKWRATVGTAVHTWLADMLAAENKKYRRECAKVNGRRCECPWGNDGTKAGLHRDRWLIELHIAVGTIAGSEVPGNLDVFDRLTGTMVDWKVTGPTTIKTVKRAGHPGEGYATQVQMYGRGLARVNGEDVKWVGVMFLPSNGELKSAFYWEEPYNPEAGKLAMNRARRIYEAVDIDSPRPFDNFVTADDHCAHCPFFSPGTIDAFECPGDPSLEANMDDAFKDLLPNG